MSERKNEPRSLVTLILSMLIFGSIGVFRRSIPLSSALLFSALFLREPLSLPGIVGAALIIGSAAVSEG